MPASRSSSPPGKAVSTETRLFAGAKEKAALDRYEKAGIPKISKSIDWGWFEWFMRPIFDLLLWLFKTTGNFGVAIIGLTFIVRLLMFPIAQKQFQSMAAMRKIQPKMKAIQERFKDDKPKQQQEILKLYQSEKINPAAGCLPILLQIPVFYALYKVLMVSGRNAPPAVRSLWIKDLSRARPADADQPVRRCSTSPRPPFLRHRRPADPARGHDVDAVQAQPGADGPDAAADLRDHAVGDGVRDGAVRKRAAALLGDQQRPDDRATMVAVQEIRAAFLRHPSR